MKKLLITLVPVFLYLAANSQSSAPQFPDSFTGTWKGILEWYPTGAKEPKKVDMELRILSSPDSAGQYIWNIIYGKPSEDNRPYILKPVDTATGHWVIDEMNGIVLDQYWIGQQFCGAFTVQGSTIVNNYRLQDGNMIVEFFSYPNKPANTTGKGSADIPYVDSYKMKSYQKAILKRQ